MSEDEAVQELADDITFGETVERLVQAMIDNGYEFPDLGL